MKPSLTIYALHDAFDASELDLRGAIAFAREIGMAGMELGYYWQEEHRECELAKQWLADAGLAASGYIISTNFVAGDETEHKKQIATVKRGIDRARQLGAPFVRVFAGSRPGRSFAEDRDVVVEALRECLAYAEAIDVKIAMENHGGIGANSEHLLYYADALASSHFGFVVDIGNFMASGGENPLEGSKRLASGALLVHCKDGAVDKDSTWSPSLLGQGDVEVEACLKAIADTGYDGYASVEFEVPMDWRVGIASEADHLHRVLERINA